MLPNISVISRCHPNPRLKPKRTLLRFWDQQRSYSHDTDSGFSCFPVIPKQESTFNTSATFKKILLKTHFTSETRCVYLELLLKFNIQINKKVALECCVHKYQQEPKKGVFTAISQSKERSFGVSVL